MNNTSVTVALTKDKTIDPDYGYLVEVDNESKGAVVGIDGECGLVFTACMPLTVVELLAIGEKIKEKQSELFSEGLLG
jgi:hypothetical protein